MILSVDDSVLQTMDLMEILIHDVGIGHRNLNVGVTEKLFYIDDISIIAKQVSSE